MASITHHVEITPSLREILDGVILSDGSYQRKGIRQTALFRLTQHPCRRGWLNSLIQSLASKGVVSFVGEVTKKVSYFEGRLMPERKYDLLRSLNYAEFVQERTRWYPNGTKIVPSDIKLTPVLLTHWFCGDGRGGDQKGTLGFCTDGFSVLDVDLLVYRLRVDLGIIALRTLNHRGHPQILVSRRDEAVKLAECVTPYLPECCMYKLKHVHPSTQVGRGRKLSDDLKIAIQRDCGNGTMREVAVKYGVSVSKVWLLWHSIESR